MRGASQRTTGTSSNLATTIHINSVVTRPKSAKKLFIKTHKNKENQISVNFRPFSATFDANTAEKQRTATPPRRIKSGRTIQRTSWADRTHGHREIFSYCLLHVCHRMHIPMWYFQPTAYVYVFNCIVVFACDISFGTWHMTRNTGHMTNLAATSLPLHNLGKPHLLNGSYPWYCLHWLAYVAHWKLNFQHLP